MTSFRLLTTVALAIAVAGGCGGSHRVNVSITWKTEKVEVSQSGDLAYSTGTDRISLNGPDGKSLTEEGRGVTIWKKQTDGSWRCVLDVMSPAEASSAK